MRWRLGSSVPHERLAKTLSLTCWRFAQLLDSSHCSDTHMIAHVYQRWSSATSTPLYLIFPSSNLWKASATPISVIGNSSTQGLIP